MQEYEALLKLAQEEPKAARSKVEERIKKHPEEASWANLLAYILLRLKKLKKANKLIEENYQRFPHLLICKINYGDLCLRKNRLDEIPQIFPSFDLQKLYPEQKKFLSTHVRGFAVLMGLYHLKIGNRPVAEKFYIQAVGADPLHPSVALLERKLFRFSWVKNFFGRS